jgi:circadian clock protein KaiC
MIQSRLRGPPIIPSRPRLTRLSSPHSRRARSRTCAQEIVERIPELDLLCGGGVDWDTSTPVLGPAGCGKSTIAAQFAHYSCQPGRACLHLYFRGDLWTMTSCTKNSGADPDRHLHSRRLSIQPIDPAELSPGKFVDMAGPCVVQEQATTIVIDSLNGLLHAMPGEEFLTLDLHELLTFLNSQGVSSFRVMVQHGLLGKDMFSPVDVSCLADSVLPLRYFEAQGEVKQAMSVVKKPGGGHERSVRELSIIMDKKIRVGRRPLDNFRGVLTEVPELLLPATHNRHVPQS